MKGTENSKSEVVQKKLEEEEEEEHHDPAIQCIENFCCLIIKPLSVIMPVKSYPIVALLMVVLLVYFMCEFILTVFNVFSVYTGISHFFVGLTLMVWGSDNLELINWTIAMKNNQLELGMSSVLSCQFICIIVIVPIAVLGRMKTRDQTEIQVMQVTHSRDIIVLPPLLIAIASFIIYLSCGMNLNRFTAFLLLSIYVGYVVFAYKYTGTEEL